MKPNIRPIFFLIVLMALGNYCLGQSQPVKTVAVQDQTFRLGTSPGTNSFTLHPEEQFSSISNSELIKELHDLFQLSNDCNLEKLKEKKDKYGNTHTYYNQYYKGIPVDGGSIIIHKRNENVTSVNGELASDLNLNTQPVLSQSVAIRAGISLWENNHSANVTGKSTLNTKSSDSRLVITTIDPLRGLTAGNTVLAYKVNVTTSNHLVNETLIIDANGGGLVNSYSNVAQCSPSSFETPFYGNQAVDIETDGTTFELLDSCRNLKTYFAGNPNGIIASNQSDFSDIDEHIRQVFWGIQTAWDYLGNYHGIFGPDNNYGPVNIQFSSFINCNASANSNEVTFYYNFNNPCGAALTGLDVCGHEYSHNVLYNLIGLNYVNEGVSIHEGMADVIGALVENANFPGSGVWTLGENSIPPYHPYLRSMVNPKSSFFKVADTYNGQYFANDYQGSGVISHAFYLLSEGSGVTDQINDNDFEYCVVGIGIQKASDILFQALQ